MDQSIGFSWPCCLLLIPYDEHKRDSNGNFFWSTTIRTSKEIRPINIHTVKGVVISWVANNLHNDIVLDSN